MRLSQLDTFFLWNIKEKVHYLLALPVTDCLCGRSCHIFHPWTSSHGIKVVAFIIVHESILVPLIIHDQVILLQDAANTVVRQKNLKIRDRLLRVCHAKAETLTTNTPSKRKSPGPKKDSPPKRLALSSGEASPGSKDNKPKAKAASLSYQGIRSSKSGVLKKTGVPRRPTGNTKNEANKAGRAEQKTSKTKRPAVAARKAKLQKKRKQEGGTPENTRRNKKARKH